MFYILTILISMAIIALFNILFTELKFWYIVGAVVLNTLSVIILDGILATLIRWSLPKKWFTMKEKTVNKKEISFYEKLKIKGWKELIPDLGFLTKTKKSKIEDPSNNEYIKNYILEINYGVLVHIASMFLGFLIAFIYPLNLFFNFAFPVAVVNFVLNLLPIFVLRYNLSKLERLYKINERRERLNKKTD
ncbi:MAG: hypothetical protein E7342_00280 [Clostridiales bacterium]|nr:hypothetical protein [Clostridiales bacterium]